VDPNPRVPNAEKARETLTRKGLLSEQGLKPLGRKRNQGKDHPSLWGTKGPPGNGTQTAQKGGPAKLEVKNPFPNNGDPQCEGP